MNSNKFKVDRAKFETFSFSSLLASVLTFTLVSSLLTEQSFAFTIIAPAAGSTLTAGSTVIARVDLGKDTGIVKVRYYWYGEQDEVLVEQDDSTTTGSIVAPVVMVGSAEQEPAFGGPLKVPQDGIGPMRLLAVAEISRGRLGARSVFDEVIVNLVPPAALTAIDFETDKPLQLGRTGQSSAFGHVDSLGKVFELPVVADFSDGITRRISRPASGTNYESSSPQVIKVLPKVSLLDANNSEASFLAPAVSEPRTYRFKLRVTDKKGADSLPAFVDVTVEP
ncbi:MAG: hypothetical protein HZC50_11380 [Nitrospirae bacterium]|nr:hypothetical protein [Nitrospirota bacterium]